MTPASARLIAATTSSSDVEAAVSSVCSPLASVRVKRVVGAVERVAVTDFCAVATASTTTSTLPGEAPARAATETASDEPFAVKSASASPAVSSLASFASAATRVLRSWSALISERSVLALAWSCCCGIDSTAMSCLTRSAVLRPLDSPVKEMPTRITSGCGT